MYCMSCGTQLPDDAKFCYKCGKLQFEGIKRNVEKLAEETIDRLTYLATEGSVTYDDLREATSLISEIKSQGYSIPEDNILSYYEVADSIIEMCVGLLEFGSKDDVKKYWDRFVAEGTTGILDLYTDPTSPKKAKLLQAKARSLYLLVQYVVVKSLLIGLRLHNIAITKDERNKITAKIGEVFFNAAERDAKKTDLTNFQH